jgi:transposase-like protein
MPRKYHDEDWLRDKYWNERMNTTEIGRMVGVTRGTISNWLRRHDIPTRGRGPEEGVTYSDPGKLKDEEWLRNQYIEQEKSTRRIAKEQDVNDVTVLNWMEKHGIDRRDAGAIPQDRSSPQDKRLESEDWLRREYEEKGRSMFDIAEQLEVSGPAVKYRLDEHGIARRNDYGPFDGGDSEFQRDPNWQSKRAKRLELDNYECQDCGVMEDEYYRSLDVHHLKKKQEFVQGDGSVDWQAANAMENMVSLCQSCHMKRHTN